MPYAQLHTNALTRHVHGRQPALRRVVRVEKHVRHGRGLDHGQHARRVPALDGGVQRAHQPVCGIGIEGKDGIDRMASIERGAEGPAG